MRFFGLGTERVRCKHRQRSATLVLWAPLQGNPAATSRPGIRMLFIAVGVFAGQSHRVAQSSDVAFPVTVGSSEERRSEFFASSAGKPVRDLKPKVPEAFSSAVCRAGTEVPALHGALPQVTGCPRTRSQRASPDPGRS